jgi:hypothetical protein
MGPYQLGTEVTIFETFTVDDVVTDPTTVTFTVEQPDDTLDVFVFGTDAEVTNPSTGYYELAYLPPSAGTYNYRVVGTGAVAAATEGSFEVLRSAILTPAGYLPGPCEQWIDAQDVAECCSLAAADGSDESVFQKHATLAVEFLHIVSGRRFTGRCGPITVRPPGDTCSNCGIQLLAYPAGASRPHRAITASGICGSCGFSALSRVLLSGYPVQEITEVKVDGVVVAETEYRLDGNKWLVRKNGESWPVCPDLSLDDDQEGTFSVSYTFGLDPTPLAREAAAALACEFYNACTPGGECKLPSQAVRIVRQGVTIDRLQPLASMLRKGETGILALDAFMEAYGKHRRKPAFWSSSGPKYARRVGA